VRDAGFSYNGADWIFRNVSFEIARGEHVALVGFNGMGKTTLSRLVAGVRPPTEGEVLLGHKVVPGYVSQDFAETIPPERALVNVLKHEDARITEAHARTLLGSFGFTGDDAFKTAGVLSGGEKIRLAFARIFAANPNFLVLDEPTTHLDINGRRALEEELVAYEGSIVLVSHDVEFVKAIAQTIIEVSDAGVRRFVGGYADYRERLDREASAARRQASAPAASEPAPTPESAPVESAAPPSAQPSGNKKEQRRQRAAEREQRLPLMRSLSRRVAAAEARIAQLEAEQNVLVASLSDTEAKPDFEGVNRRLGQIQSELATVNTLWEQAASELAFLEAE